MAIFKDQAGKIVPESEAMDSKGILRDGFTRSANMMGDRKTLSLFDSKEPDNPPSMDLAFRKVIAEAAGRMEMKPDDYLASLRSEELQKHAEGAAKSFVSMAASKGLNINFADSANVASQFLRDKRADDFRKSLGGEARIISGDPLTARNAAREQYIRELTGQ